MRILIVDDSKDELLLLETYLRNGELNDIILAESATEAFNYLGIGESAGRAEEVDLILMDIIMPEINGIEACRRIKDAENLRDIPIIIVTIKDEAESLETALGIGALDYIVKPVNKVEFLARTRSALRLKQEMDYRKAKERELEELAQKLMEANKTLERLSSLDGLTGIPNRSHFDEVFTKEWRRSAREATQISLIMIDIDFFKLFNDTYGHLEGDECLKQVAKAMADTLKRPGDFFARYGGEEFVVLLPNTDVEGAVILADAIRSHVASLGIPHAKSEISDLVTVSLGVGRTIPELNSTPAALISQADQALYEAKREGRNRVKVNK